MGAPLPNIEGHGHNPACYDPIEPCAALMAEPLTPPSWLSTGTSDTVFNRCHAVSVCGDVNPLALGNGCDRRRMLDRCGGRLIPVSLSITYPDSVYYRPRT